MSREINLVVRLFSHKNIPTALEASLSAGARFTQSVLGTCGVILIVLCCTFVAQGVPQYITQSGYHTIGATI